jgi:hypothetical protein
MAQLYKVQHRACGHIGGVGQDRAQGRARIAQLQATGNYGWRLLAIQSEAEVREALTSLALDEKCDTCRVVVPS